MSEHELREIAGYAVDCSRRALSNFEQSLPADTLPRDAMDTPSPGAACRPRALRQSTWAACKAAQEADSPAAGEHILGAAAHAAARKSWHSE
ncbi:putative immunity protein [Streptomyces sp. NPDC048434]|uniref:putative immunity protein n=1 Tax=Streptomyces sp. NPDC048434 TaxID=3365549 RepID=UPI00371B22BB